MKKIIPVIGILAGAAAFAIYKIKKDEQKQIVDLDQGLLDDEDETIEEGPINPEACCEKAVDKAESFVDAAQQKVKHLKEKTESLLDDAQEKAKDVQQAFKTKMDDAKDIAKDVVDQTKETIDEAVENGNNSQYPHLSSLLIDHIITTADDAIAQLSKEGDMHQQERPVQHKVVFSSLQDLDGFKHEVINKGFVITSGAQEHELTVLHITSINKEKLYDNMLFLADTAIAYHGSYEGWSSKVVVV